MHRPQLLRSQSISRTVAVSPTTASNAVSYGVCLNSCMKESSELKDSRLSKSLTLTERQQISLLTKSRKKSTQRKLEPSLDDSKLASGFIQEKIPKTSKKKKNKPRDRRTLVSIWLPADFESWEANRQKAWKNISKNPDAYYFSYAKPGLEIFKKAWTTNEKEKFCRLLKDRPPNDKWGLFSMHFPHRTGSQCKDFFMRKKAKDKASKRLALSKGRDKKRKRPTKSVLQAGEPSHIESDNRSSLLCQKPDLAKKNDQSSRMNSNKNDMKLVSKSIEETRSRCIGSKERESETSQRQDESDEQVNSDMNVEEEASSALTRVQPIEKRQLISNQSEEISDSVEGFAALCSRTNSAANSNESEKATCGDQQQEQSATVASSNERSITALEVLGISTLEKLDEPILSEQSQSTATCLHQSGEKPAKIRKLAQLRPMRPPTDGCTAGPPVVIPESHCRSGGKQQKKSLTVANSGERVITAPEDVLLDKLDESIPEEPIASFTSCADKEFTSVLDSQLQERTEVLQQEDKFESERTLLRKRFELDHQRLMHHFKWRLESIRENADEQSRLQLLAELADEFKQEQSLMVRLQKIQSECLLIQSRNAALLFPSSHQPQAVAVVSTVPPFW